MLNNLSASSDFIQLALAIKLPQSGNSVVFIPSPGNWGDALINRGSERFFRYFGISYVEKSRGEIESRIVDGTLLSVLQDRTVVIGGGGGWCSNWSSTQEFVLRLIPFAAKIVVLPTTFELPTPESEAVVFFRRDNGSSAVWAPNSTFCHDMAFFLDIRDLEPEQQTWRLYALRGDREQAVQAKSISGSVDLSLLGTAEHTIRPFFQILSRYREVVTDRLHVAIAASMLNKKVFILPGNYSKSYDLWRSSIEPNYSQTSFMEWADLYPSD